MKELFFSDDHLWILKEDSLVTVGITEYAFSKMKSIVFINLPEYGDIITIGENFGDIESLKTVSDLISPVSGTVIAVNNDLIDEPENFDVSFEHSWLIRVNADNISDSLMNEASYNLFIGGD